MEDTLRETIKSSALVRVLSVLILVLMEDTLRASKERRIHKRIAMS
ncbi:hypothetical protein SAMN05444364_11738 [Prevotella scopos JCM 17725]|uniref:Transcriptional regulator n=1 Tax=Prevotella scopos JCM 17725 TaxID=1236518 RepID=A0AAX2F511_9BACT|nr:hypothetical protein SAMN05444364_11738 [Prevotella scopos JCM 17725]